MMPKKKKLLCMTLVLILLLCGCGNDMPDPTVSTTAPTVAPTVAPTETQATEPTKATEPTTPMVTEPPATEPTVTEPAPTETEPAPTETEPAPTEPPLLYNPPELPEDLPAVSLGQFLSGSHQIDENTLVYLYNGYLETLELGPVQTFTFEVSSYPPEYTNTHEVTYRFYKYGIWIENVAYTGDNPWNCDYWGAGGLGPDSSLIVLSINYQGSEDTFLYDTSTEEIFDYDEKLPKGLKTFFPDGKTVLCELSGYKGYLCNCETGEQIELPRPEGSYNIDYSRLDDQTILIYSYFLSDKMEESYYILSKYDISTGKLFTFPGKYNGQGVASEYINVSSAPLAVTDQGGYLSIFDLRTMERCVTPFPRELVTRTFYCSNDTLAVICQNVLYTVAIDGTVTPICRVIP